MPTTSRLLMTSVALVAVAVIFLAPGQADADLSSPSSSSPKLGTSLKKIEVQSSSTFNSSSNSFSKIHNKTVDEVEEDEEDEDEDEKDEVHVRKGGFQGGKEDYYGANAAILAWIEGHWWVILIIVVIVAIIAGAICCFIYTKK